MKLIIRYIRTKGQGEEIEQTVFNGERLLIGRGTDQDIHLSGPAIALAHAQLTATNTGFKIVANKGGHCVFNGRLLGTLIVEPGQEFGVSGYSIKVLQDTTHKADAILEVHMKEDVQEELQERFKTDLSDLGISKRGWSWILFVVILAAGLLIPMSGTMSPLWRDILRESPLPDDTLWQSGDLHRAHRFMGEQCEQCHVEPFVQVSDTQCQRCHTDTQHHLDKRHYSLQQSLYDACTDCHKEHSASFDLAQRSEQVCAGCHQDLQQAGLNTTKYQAASDFATVHPNFKVSVVTPTREEDVFSWMIQRQLLSSPNLEETSHLKFSHQLHLSKQGIMGPDSINVLQCQDCHQMEPGGSTMMPVRMDEHCQQCHQLTFEPDDPSRVVPHGPADEVVTMLREYYGFRYVYRHLINQDDISISEVGDLFSVREARRPGQQGKTIPMSNETVGENTAKTIALMTKQGVRTDALQWAEGKAFEAANMLFEKTACHTCHEVQHDAALDIPWKVKPIRLTEVWFPLAQFSHDKHQLTQCIDCHEANQSSRAQDILMPGIDNCRQCHGGEQSRELIPSACIECHQFHFDSGSLIPELADVIKSQPKEAGSNEQ